MKFVEVEVRSQEGAGHTKVYVNPEHVVAMRKSAVPGYCHVFFTNMEKGQEVKGTGEELKKLFEAPW